MDISKIKFETRLEMTDALRNESDCLKYLSYIRWNGTPTCCQCGSVRISWYEKREKYRCKDCRYFFTATTNTAFHSCKNTLRKYFTMLADRIVSTANSQTTFKDLKVSPRVSWHMGAKFRTSLMNSQQNTWLTGTVEIDETYIGGKGTSDLRLATAIWQWEREQDKINGVSDYKRRKNGDLYKRGRKPGTKNSPKGIKKEPNSWRTKRQAYGNQIAVLGMKQRHGPCVYVVLGRGKSSVSLNEVLPFLQKFIDPDAMVISDDASHYRTLKLYFPNHQVIKKKTGKCYFDQKTGKPGRTYCTFPEIDGKRRMITVNGLEDRWGHLKAEYRGEYSFYTAEHMQGYLAEFAFRNKKGTQFDKFQSKFNDLLLKMCASKITVNDVKKFTLDDDDPNSKRKRRRVLRIVQLLSICCKKAINQIQLFFIRS